MKIFLAFLVKAATGSTFFITKGTGQAKGSSQLLLNVD
jgi:hypothetical protein